MINIKINGIDKLMKQLDPKKVHTAARSALERTKTQTKTEAVRLIQKGWNIKKKDLEKKSSGAERIKVSGRVSNDLTATLTFFGGGISLAYFGAKEYRMAGGKMRVIDRMKSVTKKMTDRDTIGVKVQIQKGKTTALRQFMAAVKYGKGDNTGYHIGVFRHAPGGGRYANGNRKIIESESVSIISMVTDQKVIIPLQKFVVATFNKRMNHELKYRKLID